MDLLGVTYEPGVGVTQEMGGSFLDLLPPAALVLQLLDLPVVLVNSGSEATEVSRHATSLATVWFKGQWPTSDSDRLPAVLLGLDEWGSECFEVGKLEGGSEVQEDCLVQEVSLLTTTVSSSKGSRLAESVVSEMAAATTDGGSTLSSISEMLTLVTVCCFLDFISSPSSSGIVLTALVTIL